MRLNLFKRKNRRPPVSSLIRVSRTGSLQINLIDILSSEEGHNTLQQAQAANPNHKKTSKVKVTLLS